MVKAAAAWGGLKALNIRSELLLLRLPRHQLSREIVEWLTL